MPALSASSRVLKLLGRHLLSAHSRPREAWRNPDRPIALTIYSSNYNSRLKQLLKIPNGRLRLRRRLQLFYKLQSLLQASVGVSFLVRVWLELRLSQMDRLFYVPNRLIPLGHLAVLHLLTVDLLYVHEILPVVQVLVPEYPLLKRDHLDWPIIDLCLSPVST